MKGRITTLHDMAPRRHKCEKCGGVFVCEDCTEMMHRSAAKAIYSHNHGMMGHGAFADSSPRKPWLCENCA